MSTLFALLAPGGGAFGPFLSVDAAIEAGWRLVLPSPANVEPLPTGYRYSTAPGGWTIVKLNGIPLALGDLAVRIQLPGGTR